MKPTVEQVRRVVTYCSESRAERLIYWMDRQEINTPVRCAMFLAQLAHESDMGRAWREYASGAAYEGRADLGNYQPGDGERYAGRDGIMVTGRGNYTRLTKYCQQTLDLDVDFVQHPELLETEAWCGIGSGWFWRHGAVEDLNIVADRGDFDWTTKLINGGWNGKESRERLYAVAKEVFGLAGAPNTRTLRKGDSGEAVTHLQSRLKQHGAIVLLDGVFGPMTAERVKEFQNKSGLVADGIVGPMTWARLEEQPAWRQA